MSKKKLYTDSMHIQHLNEVYDSNFTDVQLYVNFDHLLNENRKLGFLSPEKLMEYITTTKCGELVKKYIPTDFYTTKADTERIINKYF